MMTDYTRTARAIAWTSTRSWVVLPKPKTPRHLSGRLRTKYQRDDLSATRAMRRMMRFQIPFLPSSPPPCEAFPAGAHSRSGFLFWCGD